MLGKVRAPNARPDETAPWSEGPPAPYVERIRSLAAGEQPEGLAYQSVLVAALKVLARAQAVERQVLDAAISLAQREKLGGMIATLEEVSAALRESLNAGASRVVDLSPPEPANAPSERYWWFALTEATQALGDGAELILSLVASRPRGSASRTLGSIVARLLHRHQNELLAEADQWMGNGE